MSIKKEKYNIVVEEFFNFQYFYFSNHVKKITFFRILKSFLCLFSSKNGKNIFKMNYNDN